MASIDHTLQCLLIPFSAPQTLPEIGNRSVLLASAGLLTVAALGSSVLGRNLGSRQKECRN